MKEEYINIYITNDKKADEWKYYIENHYVDPKRESSDREERLADYFLMTARAKGYERLEDYDKEAGRYIAHVPSMQFLVTEKYNATHSDEHVYNASFLVVGFENIWVMTRAKESQLLDTPMTRDLNEVMKTGQTPYLMFSLCARDNNPRVLGKIMDDMFEITKNMAHGLDSNNKIHMVVSEGKKHTCISKEEDMRKYLDSLYTKGIPDLSGDTKGKSKQNER